MAVTNLCSMAENILMMKTKIQLLIDRNERIVLKAEQLQRKKNFYRLVRQLTISILVLIGLLPTHLFAQQQILNEINCGTSEQVNSYYKQNPKARVEAEEFNKHTKNRRSNATGRQAIIEEYVIPVVFHVFGTEFNEGSTVTDDIIKEALRKTNEDFKGMTPGQNDLSATFLPVRRTLNVTFKLAAKDPNGNATTGINYYPLASGLGANNTDVPRYAWDNYKYVNVYIMRDLYGDNVYGRSGIAWYPDTFMSNNNLARVVYNGSYLGTNTSENFRRVLTHEFGHFMNLIHTFEGGCSYPNDLVDDTPPADRPSIGDACRTGINCFGQAINGENFMEYSSCYKMFTNGQVDRMIAALEDHPARRTLWQNTNVLNVLGGGPAQALLMPDSKREFVEAPENNGTTTSFFEIGAVNNTWVSTFTEGVHYTTTNVPAGMSVKITSLSPDKVKVELTGTAIAHAKANNTNNLVIRFEAPAFSNGSLSNLLTPTVQCKIVFVDQSVVVGTNVYMGDGTGVSTALPEASAFLAKDLFFPIDAPENNAKFGNALFGILSSQDFAKLQSYSKGIVCDNADVAEPHISLLNYNTMIGSSSNWNVGGSNQHYFVSPTYSTWKGQTGFVGVRLYVNNRNHYGWMRVKISASGKNVTVLEWAYNRVPDAPINAGESPTIILGTPNSSEIYEDEILNDGTFTDTKSIFLYGNTTFAVSNGNLQAGVHYTISGLPAGLSPIVTISNSRSAVLSFSGKAQMHGTTNNVRLDFRFQNAAFTNVLPPSRLFSIAAKFYDPYEIRYAKGFRVWNGDYNVFEDSITATLQNNNREFIITEKTNDNTNTTQYSLARFGIAASQGYSLFYTKANGNDVLCTDGAALARTLPLSFIAPISQVSATWNSGRLGSFSQYYFDPRPSDALWKDRTAYLGLRFIDIIGNTHYGWIKASVARDGSSVTFYEYAYNSAPDKPILAGQKSDYVMPDAPTNLIASSIVQTSFILRWDRATDNVGVANYDIFLNGILKGSTPETSITITGVVANTTYAITVKARDNSNNSSNPSSALQVTTLPYCTPSYGYDYSWIARVKLNEIDNSTTGFPPNGYADFTALPAAKLARGITYPISVDLAYINNSSMGIGVWIDLNQNGLFTDPGEQVLLASPVAGTQLTGTITIPANAPYGTTRMRVRGAYRGADISPCGYDSYMGEAEDYSVIINDTEAPTAPLNLTATTVTQSSFTLRWDSSSDNVGITGYDIFLNGILKSSTAQTSFNVTGLIVNTAYTVTVKAKDNFNNSSDPSTLQVTTLPYCAASYGYDYSWIARVKLNEIDNSTTGFPPNGYADFTALPAAKLSRGLTYAISVDLAYINHDNMGIGVWIDLNQNGLFTDPGEQLVLARPAAGTQFSGTITIPSNALYGTTRMRVRGAYRGADMSPCGDDSYMGEAEDYSIVVIDSDAPSVPSNLVASAITQTSFTLRWDRAIDNIGVANYDIFLNGILKASTPETSFNVTGLAVNTTYTVTIRARDNSNNSSDPSAVLQVLTLPYCTASHGYDYSWIARVKLNEIDNNTTGFPPIGYSDFTALLAAKLSRGLTYPISVDLAYINHDTMGIGVWIDLNQNGLFTDPGEQLLLVHPATGSQLNGAVITIPSSAALGTTRMRVRGAYRGTDISPCGYDSYMGEVEDYSVTIINSDLAGATGEIHSVENVEKGFGQNEVTRESGEIFNKNSIIIFPNPNKGKFTLQLENEYIGEIDITIVSPISGNCGKALSINKSSNRLTHEINLENIAAGIYFINLRSSEFNSSKMILLEN